MYSATDAHGVSEISGSLNESARDGANECFRRDTEELPNAAHTQAQSRSAAAPAVTAGRCANTPKSAFADIPSENLRILHFRSVNHEAGTSCQSSCFLPDSDSAVDTRPCSHAGSTSTVPVAQVLTMAVPAVPV